GITKSGAGVVAFSGANTYGGDTHVNAGAIQVEADDALGDTEGVTFVASGASVYFASSSLSVPEEFLIAGTGVSSQGALWVASGDATLTGAITLQAASQLGAASGSSLTLDGVLDDGGNAYDLTVTNGATGRTVLTGDNIWEGDTTVTLGYLRATSNNALGDSTTSSTVTVQFGATLELSGGITVPATKSLALTGNPVSGMSKIMGVAGNNTVLGDIALSSNNESADVADGTTLTLA